MRALEKPVVGHPIFFRDLASSPTEVPGGVGTSLPGLKGGWISTLAWGKGTKYSSLLTSSILTTQPWQVNTKGCPEHGKVQRST